MKINNDSGYSVCKKRIELRTSGMPTIAKPEFKILGLSIDDTSCVAGLPLSTIGLNGFEMFIYHQRLTKVKQLGK
jgi:hypothetical protein